jgi:hypothetical protein
MYALEGHRFQLGGQATDFVLLVMNAKALDRRFPAGSWCRCLRRRRSKGCTAGVRRTSS